MQGCCTTRTQGGEAPVEKAEPVTLESSSSQRCTWLAVVCQLPQQAWLAQGTGLKPEPVGLEPASWGLGNVGPRAGVEG